MTALSICPSPIRVLIVDDHALVREGLQALIAQQPDMLICGQAEDEPTALRLVRETLPHVMVTDISLKSGSGIDLIKQVRARHRETRILVTSMHDENLYAERAIQAGAMGYINKQESTERVVDGIRTVLNGQIYLSDRMANRLLSRVVGRPAEVKSSPVESLTNRELQVFEMLGHGNSVREIARRLHLSPKTVERYRENLKQKLGLNSASELLRHATQWVLESH